MRIADRVHHRHIVRTFYRKRIFTPEFNETGQLVLRRCGHSASPREILVAELDACYFSELLTEQVQLPDILLHILITIASGRYMKYGGIAALCEITRELLLAVAGDRHRHQLTFLIDRHHADTLEAHDRLDQRTGVTRSDIVSHVKGGVAAAA